jgi:FKBP-type peptidyl-prolyl cis-trans isomerase SlyD
MTVKKDKVVEMHCTLKNDKGEVIDSTEGRDTMVFLQGHSNIVPGLEKSIEGMKVGESNDVVVQSKEAYGDYHAEGVQTVFQFFLSCLSNALNANTKMQCFPC